MSGHSDNPDTEMHHEVDWLRPSDRRILVEIADYGKWIRPSTLYLNLPYGNKHTANRCRELTERGMLEKHEDVSAYRLAEFGRAFLNDELSVDDLRAA